MTFNIGHIEGGTDAGWRRVKQERKDAWTCECGVEKPAYLANCPDCKATNPNA